MSYVLHDSGSLSPPQEITPIFYGCFDWHSAVHNHWLLVRALRVGSEEPWAVSIRLALDESFRSEKVARELKTLEQPGWEGFERPYGLAWFLKLMAELRGSVAGASVWADILGPLEEHVVSCLSAWLPTLTYPIRTGQHDQTAFSLILICDWAREVGHEPLQALVQEFVWTHFRGDEMAPLAYEPSGYDFLSPSLAEAALLGKLSSPEDFAAWLARFLPQIPEEVSTIWLEPVPVKDPKDGKGVHLAGLNLSRAWMLQLIANALPKNHPKIPTLQKCAKAHAQAGRSPKHTTHYAGSHWLPTFNLLHSTKVSPTKVTHKSVTHLLKKNCL
jgi:hypothetical protein